MVAEALAAEVVLGEAEMLDLGAARAVEHEDAVGGRRVDRVPLAPLAHATGADSTRPSRSHTARASSARLRV